MGRGINEQQQSASGLSRRGRGCTPISPAQQVRLLLEEGDPVLDKDKFDALSYEQLMLAGDEHIKDFVYAHGIVPLLKACSNGKASRAMRLLIKQSLFESYPQCVAPYIQEWLPKAAQQLWYQLAHSSVPGHQAPGVAETVGQTDFFSLYPNVLNAQTSDDIPHPLTAFSFGVQPTQLEEKVLDNILEFVHDGGDYETYDIQTVVDTYLDANVRRAVAKRYDSSSPPEIVAYSKAAIKACDPYYAVHMQPGYKVVNTHSDARQGLNYMKTIALHSDLSELVSPYSSETSHNPFHKEALEELAAWDEQERLRIASTDTDPEQTLPRQLWQVETEGQPRSQAEWLAFHVARASGWSPQEAVDFCHRCAKLYLDHS